MPAIIKLLHFDAFLRKGEGIFLCGMLSCLPSSSLPPVRRKTKISLREMLWERVGLIQSAWYGKTDLSKQVRFSYSLQSSTTLMAPEPPCSSREKASL